MLKPSYAELMDVLNENNEDKSVNSRYTVVIAAAKRARQLIDGDEPMVEGSNPGKPVSTAVEELFEGKIKIVGPGEGTRLELYKKRPGSEEEVRAEVEEDLAKALAEGTGELPTDVPEGFILDLEDEDNDMLSDAYSAEDELDETLDFDDDSIE